MRNSNIPTYILKETTLMNDARQAIIEIDNMVEIEKIEILLNESIFYLEKNIDFNAANELFILIITCFSKFPAELMPFFKKIFQKSKCNANYIIITTEILYLYLYYFNYSSFIQPYEDFVNKSLIDLLPQIHNQTLSIFSHEIPHRFEFQLIINILLCSKLNETIVNAFTSYIFSQDCSHFNDINKKKTMQFIENIINADYINIITTYLTSNFNLFIGIQPSCFKKLISFLSDQLFTNIFNGSNLENKK